MSCGYVLLTLHGRGLSDAEDLTAPDQHDNHQHQGRNDGNPDRQVDEQQAAGENASHQQPKCRQDDRQHGSELDHLPSRP